MSSPPLRPGPASSASTEPHHPARRRAGVALSTLATAVIAGATLVPLKRSPFEEAPLWQWCLVCGRMGGADVLQNIGLFTPFGVGLALAGLRPRAAALAGLLLSGTVELIQALALEGRFPSASDLVTNTTGTLIGALIAASWRTWARPSPARARRLAAASTAVWLAVVAGGAVALGRTPGAGPAVPRVPVGASVPYLGWYAGSVRRARFDTLVVPHTGTGPVVVVARTRVDVDGSVEVAGSDVRGYSVPMLYVHADDDSPSAFMLAQQNRSAVVAAGLRAATLRLRNPSLRLPDAFPGDPAAARQPRTIAGAFRAGTLHVSVTSGGTTRRRSLALPPTLGWALIFPFVRPDGPERSIVTAAWLAIFLVPLGYWTALALGGRWRIVAPALGTLVAVGLAGIPASMGAPVPPVEDWAAALAAIAAGAATARAIAARAAPLAGSPSRAATASPPTA